jgi:pimeloyl-ACP methyl ester carboxylesterase
MVDYEYDVSRASEGRAPPLLPIAPPEQVATPAKPTKPAEPARLAWRETLVNGRRTRYAVAGDGEPLVLVHGLCGSTRWWRRNLDTLARHARVHLLDLPGFGAMSRWRGRFALAEAADWLYAWMRAVSLPPACLVGHSMGGYICLQLAARHPEVVHRLALAAPAGIPTGHSMLGEALPLARALLHTSPRFYPILLADALRAGPHAVLRAASDVMRGDVRELLAQVAPPTLLIWGARDTLVPAAAGAVMRDALPNARLLTLGGASHVAMFDRPHAFNSALLRFLQGEVVGE